jgi:hypothetical protein
MQHGEGNSSRKLAFRKGHSGAITGDYLNVAAVQTQTQRLRQLRVNFDCREALRGESDEIGCETGAWSQLQDISAEVGTCKDPRYSSLNHFAPPRRAAQPSVQAVHELPTFRLSLPHGTSLILAAAAHIRYCDNQCCKSANLRFSILWEIFTPRL